MLIHAAFFLLFRTLSFLFTVSTEHRPSVTPFDSNKKSDFTGKEVIIWGAVSAFLCIPMLVVVVHFARRQRKRRKGKY